MTSALQALWDWRRRVAALYAAVREASDPQAGWSLWRQTRDGLFRDHPQSPLEPSERAGFAGLPFFDYDPALRFEVALVPVQDAAEERFAAGADGELRMLPFAVTQGLRAALGGELTVYWLLGYCGGAFLPFADATSGRETYGAGRYLLDTIKSADLGTTPTGATVLDFNFAYNPSCAYSPRWSCPLAPQANRLPNPVRAGEKAPIFVGQM
ncbi:MAG TPA: DUF1684 domain-containing protein [Acetobacteraceae bacterium]|nr:DUF1684 domain-containing protein [Acetobacteraceae bacterium]